MTITPTTIDRTVHLTLNNSTTSTPTSLHIHRNKISSLPHIELQHRLHGTSLIAEATYMIYHHSNKNHTHTPSSVSSSSSSSSVYTTACVLFHRFYHRVSLCQWDVWSVAMGCVMLAGKLEECPVRLRRLVLVFAHLYRRRRMGVGYVSDDDDVTNAGCQCRVLTDSEKRNVLRFQKAMSPLGQEYRIWEDVLVSAECEILRQLGFMLSWISDSHPHKFILYIVRAVYEDEDGDLITNTSDNKVAQLAWNYCNDSYRIDLCTHYEAEIIVSLVHSFYHHYCRCVMFIFYLNYNYNNYQLQSSVICI